MRLTIKTLDQKTVHINFADSNTVWQLKTHLWMIPEISIRPEHQQLMYAGREIRSAHVLRSYNIDERKFILLLIKEIASPRNDIGSRLLPNHHAFMQQTISPNQTDEEIKKIRAIAAATAVAPSVINALKALLDSIARIPANKLNDIHVQNITAMGYEPIDVKRALVASYNDPDRAVEFLVEGIPDIANEQNNTNNNNNNNAGSKSNTLAFLRNDFRFHQMRRLIQLHPDMLGSVLSQLGESSPPLLALIRDHQKDFVEILNENLDNTQNDEVVAVQEQVQAAASTATNKGNDSTPIILSKADEVVVNRLMTMGKFERTSVVKAYIDCKRDEELTKQFLTARYAAREQ